MNREKTANHGGHGEHGDKTKPYGNCSDRQQADRIKHLNLKIFAVPAVFAVVI